MLLLGVLVVTPALMVLLLTARCVILLAGDCWDRSGPMLLRDWLSETIPVLVAIIMTGRGRPPPPP